MRIWNTNGHHSIILQILSNFLTNKRSIARLLVGRKETILSFLTTIVLVCAELKCNVVLSHSHKVSQIVDVLVASF